MLKPYPNCDNIRRWGLWEKLDHEDGALTNGISALIKGNPESFQALFLPWGGHKKMRVYNMDEGPHHNLFILAL